MTENEMKAFIISKWLMEHWPSTIVMYLVCLGHPTTKSQVMQVIRNYVDTTTENITLGKKIRQ